MKVSWSFFHFKEFNPELLYQVWALREEVFVVEQNCVYQDADGEDRHAYHLCAFRDKQLIAYCRLYRQNTEIHIGRVVIRKAFRGQKLAYTLMEKAHCHAKEVFPECRGIRISAQMYLKAFYLNLGYKVTGDSYLEDGIPHIPMYKATD